MGMFPVTTFFTGRKESAILVADSTSVQIALLWLRVLNMTLPDATLAYPDFDGMPMKHIERKFQAATRTIGHSLPTATFF